jgi:transcriptional regulator with XRE-family HTH domain
MTTTLADFVRERRTTLGYTQEQLDNLIGKDRGYIGMLEIKRINRPRPPTLRALAEALQVPVERLLIVSGQLDEPAEDDASTLLLQLDELPTSEERRAAFRDLPLPLRRVIRKLMRDLFDEAAQQLEE